MNKERITFKYCAPEAKAVFLVGSFNGWNTSANPLKKNKEGTWSTAVNLFPGTYEYLYVVDGEWRDDPDCWFQLRCINKYGGYNCVLCIEE